MVATYGLLVFDEAHAIKNLQTKRSKTALSLEADFRIASTGTPLQNHLGELWNLFEFLNPGLLGTRKSFGNKYLNPIQDLNDELAQRSQRELIRP